MSLTITKGTVTLTNTRFVFPAGEIGVKLQADNLLYKSIKVDHQLITARLHSSEDVMELVMAVDALRRIDKTPIKLFCPYLPYSRQDRVCVPGEAFSLKAFADIINNLGFAEVITADAHSDVTGAVLNNVRLLTQLDIIGKFDAFANMVMRERAVFVSPDAGANKKTSEIAKYFSHETFLRADKLRELSTGKIKEIVVVNAREEVEGRTVVIVDDLCDAGGTFMGLATALRAKGARRVELYVTHGLFTKGTDILYKGGIDAVWATDSYHAVWPANVEKVNTLKLQEMYSL